MTKEEDALKSLIRQVGSIGKVREDIQQTIVHMTFNDKTNILFHQAIEEILVAQHMLEDAIEEAINYYSMR